MANKNSIKKRKIHRDCWDLEYTFIQWLNEHCKVYLKDTSKFINLTFHKFTYEGVEYTQEEVIKMMISLSDNLLKIDDDWSIQYYKDRDKLLDLWKLVIGAMWW